MTSQIISIHKFATSVLKKALDDANNGFDRIGGQQDRLRLTVSQKAFEENYLSKAGIYGNSITWKHWLKRLNSCGYKVDTNTTGKKAIHWSWYGNEYFPTVTSLFASRPPPSPPTPASDANLINLSIIAGQKKTESKKKK
jgi:hypothetical protein